MNIISVKKRENGSYPNIQTWDETYPVPSGYAIWPNDVTTHDFYNNGGFGLLNISDGYVQSFLPDSSSWENYQKDNPNKNTEEILALKNKLVETDYKIIKSYEYFLAGEEIPYNISALHSERQSIRDKINQLEG